MWKEIWSVYWKRILGAAAGLFCSIVYLAFGFWDMLFVALLVFAGYWFGKQKESSNGPVIPWQRIWETIMDRFRPFR
ncbi:DUF2273 domain-containing protein [Paenibacillus agaridevorans]|uniref:DUF2273 domain-containing protein n=1 Tax=Paenibacillus agaridevorans TaxID=171404 RepID=UPI001BE46916|nr:DUF2273 domain-containing protein [Paenibacillus agaridevorans]